MPSSKNISSINRDIYVFEDESKPQTSQAKTVYPKTILDQVIDDQSPVLKTLREIIADLKMDIITGGKGNIVFPVTSVNGKTDDVIVTAKDVGLGNVDNTRDINKPLSGPQRTAIMSILKNYNFNVDLSKLYNHLGDSSNPHKVSVEQLNKDGSLTTEIMKHLSIHNDSTSNNTHPDIRRSIAALWDATKRINDTSGVSINRIMKNLDLHLGDANAHQELFDAAEKSINKVYSFDAVTNCDYNRYPSTKAVEDRISDKLLEYDESHKIPSDWIEDVQVISYRSELPVPNEKYEHALYFIRQGDTSQIEVARCRRNPSGTYSWDINQLGAFYKLDNKYLKDSADGITIKMEEILAAMISKNGMLDTSLAEILSAYYTKDDINTFGYLTNVTILPGTTDGTIRFYINNDLTTMSSDIGISGLKRLAYKEWITENELYDQSVHSKHIISKALETRHFATKAVTPDKLSCKNGYILGNATGDPDGSAEEISLTNLANYLRPLIGGWPDPTVPGGNPWADKLEQQIVHPHLWKANEEQDLGDGSYAMRFTGDISTLPNTNFKEILSAKLTTNSCKIIECGGMWVYQSNPVAWTMLGGSNVTGHTFGTITIDLNGIIFDSISIGDRMNAEYDIWIRYIKLT